jgi:hypothetical protein
MEVDSPEYYDQNVEHNLNSPALRGSGATQEVDPIKVCSIEHQGVLSHAKGYS